MQSRRQLSMLLMSAQTLRRRLGRRVRDLRVQAEMTQEQLAARAGITWRYVSAIERGTKAATVETLVAITAATGVSISELFLGVDQPLPREMSRLELALMACSTEEQKIVLRIVEEALRLAGQRPER